jgi:hypothetical protein
MHTRFFDDDGWVGARLPGAMSRELDAVTRCWNFDWFKSF